MIPHLDLKAQYQALKPEIDAAVLRVLDSSEYILGSEVARFEQDFAAYCQARHGVGVNSGTSALHLALLAAGVGEGDEVITVPYTFIATTAAIRYTGAKPVFVDIEPVTYNMDTGQVEARITPRTKAILPVHLYGQPADMDPICEVARRHGLAVIEDAAQAHGAEYKGRRVGSLGDLAAFSFYPTKNLGACGEGGMVTTGGDVHDEMLRKLRNWGAENRYYNVLKGYNYRMDGIQGAILQVKLQYLEQWTESKRGHAALYTELLRDSGVVTPRELDSVRHVYHVYAIVSEERDRIAAHLAAREIHYAIHYPVPTHLSEAHADLGYQAGEFPVSERIARQVLSLPLFPEMTRAQVEEVSEAVREAVGTAV